MVRVNVHCVWPDTTPGGQYVVVLREADGDRALPVPIKVHEARAIQWALDGVLMQRPMTHDLWLSCVGDLGAKLDSVVVHGRRDDTYLADLILRTEGRARRVDARPSDGAALALRCEAPIYVSEKLLEEAATRVVQSDGGVSLVAGRSISNMVPGLLSNADEDDTEDEPAEDDEDIDEFKRILGDAEIDDDT